MNVSELRDQKRKEVEGEYRNVFSFFMNTDDKQKKISVDRSFLFSLFQTLS